MRFVLCLCLVLAVAAPGHAVDVTPEFLQSIERLRRAVEWNDRQVFSIELKQSLQEGLVELEHKLGIRSRLNPDQVQLDQIYGGLLTGWLIIALDAALSNPASSWKNVRLLDGALQPWLAGVDPGLGVELKRAIKLAQLAPDMQTREGLFATVRPRLAEIVNTVFDPIAASKVTAASSEPKTDTVSTNATKETVDHGD